MRKRRLIVTGIAAGALIIGTPVAALAMAGGDEPAPVPPANTSAEDQSAPPSGNVPAPAPPANNAPPAPSGSPYGDAPVNSAPPQDTAPPAPPGNAPQGQPGVSGPDHAPPPAPDNAPLPAPGNSSPDTAPPAGVPGGGPDNGEWQ